MEAKSASPRANDQEIRLEPADEFNRRLVAQVHPPDWTNPVPTGRYNLVVVGAGTAGLVAAAGAAGLGAKVALVERHLMGGDCLNVGCVPSKALIRAGRAAADTRRAGHYGVRGAEPISVDFAAVMERMRRLRAAISPHDSAHRFRGLGVDVYLGEAAFTGPDTLDAGGRTIRFHRAILATGTRPAVPSIPGLADAGYLTNETVFSLTERPARLAVLGAGPIGCELAQAFARFGSEVTLLEAAPRILGREDPEAAAIVERALVSDGVRVRCGAVVEHVRRDGDGLTIALTSPDADPKIVRADSVLVGAGRAPNIEGLGLERAGVRYEANGVVVDDRLRTTNPRIFAAGDIASPFRFTHMADAMARIALQNALFLGRARMSALTVPWCTYTDPELAHVGLTEAEAAEKGLALTTFLQPLTTVDRAILDGDDEGFVKVHVRKGTDRILGATIVARHAGDLISEITLAMVGGLGLKDIARTIHPYPTQAAAIKTLGDAFNRTRLTPRVKKLVATWLSWRR